MYLRMVVDRLLISIYYIYIELFIKKAEIIFTNINVTFDKFKKVLNYIINFEKPLRNLK